MANATTATQVQANTAVEPLVQVNRDLVQLWTKTAETSLQTALEVQNAAFVAAQTWLDTSAALGRETLRRWADVSRQAHATTASAVSSASAALLVPPSFR